MKYAGFWKRLGAAIIDVFLAALITCVLIGITALVLLIIVKTDVIPQGATGINDVVGNIFFSIWMLTALIVPWLYFARFESSQRQATIGKSTMGIYVARDGGGRLSFGRATIRHFSKIVSCIPAYIGFIMAGFTAKKQALHDMIAGSVVIEGVIPPASSPSAPE